MQALGFLSQTLCMATILAACSGSAPVTYAGDLTPQSGACDPPSRAILVRRGPDLQFTPAQGVLILDGQITPAGELTASLSTPGADHKPYLLKLTAILAGQTITGSYVTPRCRYAVHLAQSP